MRLRAGTMILLRFFHPGWETHCLRENQTSYNDVGALHASASPPTCSKLPQTFAQKLMHELWTIPGITRGSLSQADVFKVYTKIDNVCRKNCDVRKRNQDQASWHKIILLVAAFAIIGENTTLSVLKSFEVKVKIIAKQSMLCSPKDIHVNISQLALMVKVPFPEKECEIQNKYQTQAWLSLL